MLCTGRKITKCIVISDFCFVFHLFGCGREFQISENTIFKSTQYHCSNFFSSTVQNIRIQRTASNLFISLEKNRNIRLCEDNRLTFFDMQDWSYPCKWSACVYFKCHIQFFLTQTYGMLKRFIFVFNSVFLMLYAVFFSIT